MKTVSQDPWFVEERAFAFASVVLTRHGDVAVRAHAGSDMAVDLLVEVLQNGKSTLRFFGVQLVASLDLPKVQDADERTFSRLPGERFESTLPLCVFVIGVRKPEGIYRWYAEPVVVDGRPLLRRDVRPPWQALDDAGVEQLRGQVNAWYDALNGNPPSTPRGRLSKTGSKSGKPRGQEPFSGENGS